MNPIVHFLISLALVVVAGVIYYIGHEPAISVTLGIVSIFPLACGWANAITGPDPRKS